VTSPTFALCNEYLGSDNTTLLLHFDLYRVIDTVELFDIGWDDYLARGCPVAVEWAERAEGLLPGGTVRVELRRVGENEREIAVQK